MMLHLHNKYPVNCEPVIQSVSKPMRTIELNGEYQFSNDWVSDQYEYWVEVFSRYINKHDTLNILQIGVFEGRMTVMLHNHILMNNTCQFFCVDNFGKSENIVFQDTGTDMFYNNSLARNRFLYNTRNITNMCLLEGDFSEQIIPEGERFDIIILDIDERTVLDDIKICLKYLTMRGVLCVTYELNCSQLANIKNILPPEFKISFKYDGKRTFDNLNISLR